MTGPTADWISTEARAKLNLRLRIFPGTPDGFHPIETIFCRIDLADRVGVRLTASSGVSIRVRGDPRIPEGPENLAVRAAERFLAVARTGPGVEIELDKRVPAGAGLGGGSADAAAVLRLLNGLLEEPLDPGAMLEVAGHVGSDVPFFLADTPLALGYGRGDRLFALAPLPPRPILVLVPSLAVSTADAYSIWDAEVGEPASGSSRLTPPPSFIDWTRVSGWESIRAHAMNDFEPVLLPRYPELAALKRTLEETGPILAGLSGSGSALFGVYATEAERDAAARTCAPHARLAAPATGPV